jgi:hypothetical protein
MSNFKKMTFNPTTGKEEEATWEDRGRDGYYIHFNGFSCHERQYTEYLKLKDGILKNENR